MGYQLFSFRQTPSDLHCIGKQHFPTFFLDKVNLGRNLLRRPIVNFFHNHTGRPILFTECLFRYRYRICRAPDKREGIREAAVEITENKVIVYKGHLEVIFKVAFSLEQKIIDYSEPWGILNGEPQITQITQIKND